MTEGENEDSDPGGTSVLRVTCLEYVFGPSSVFKELADTNTLSTVERTVTRQKGYDEPVDRSLYSGAGTGE